MDARSDIYSLGVIVYEMVCGHVPFVSDGIGDLLVRHITEPPQRLSKLNPAVPPDLERTVLRALAKSPADRYESMSAFDHALRECQGRRDSPARAAIPAEAQTLGTAETMRPSPGIRATQTTLSSTLGEVAGDRPDRNASRLRRVFIPMAGILVIGAIALAFLGARSKLSSAERPASPVAQPPSLQVQEPPAAKPMPPAAAPAVPPQVATTILPGASGPGAATKDVEAKDPKPKATALRAKTPSSSPATRATSTPNESVPAAALPNPRLRRPSRAPASHTKTLDDEDDKRWGSRI